MDLYTSEPGFEETDTTSSLSFSTLDTINDTNTPIPKSSGVSRFYPIIVTEMVLSIVCLIATITVYSILPEFRNVHGKNLISLSSCLISAFVFLILDLLLRNHLSTMACYVFALIIHCSFLATFFWTNVMAFDICKSMSVLKPKSEVGGSSKYRKYSIYAWTATALTALPAAVFDRTDWLAKEYRPNFGRSRCWLSGTTAFVLYFNAPVGVLLLSNMLMFFITIWSLIKIKKMTDKMHIKQQRQRFNLYVKLLLVVGAIWFMEFLPWATGIYKLYALAGIMTCLHGVFLFIIFVCKRRIIKQVCQKLNLRCWPSFVDQKTSMTNNSTSSSRV